MSFDLQSLLYPAHLLSTSFSIYPADKKSRPFVLSSAARYYYIYIEIVIHEDEPRSSKQGETRQQTPSQFLIGTWDVIHNLKVNRYI